jgi:hypothetical protein
MKQVINRANIQAVAWLIFFHCAGLDSGAERRLALLVRIRRACGTDVLCEGVLAVVLTGTKRNIDKGLFSTVGCCWIFSA